MKRLMTICIMFAGLLVMSVMAGQANAAITTVSGPASTLGTLPEIIAAPPDVLDDVVFNTGMQGFDEAQGVLTTVAHAHDSGVIPAGTVVNSHMIFLNISDLEELDELDHLGVTWTFANPILGVMSDRDGTLEAGSTFELGNPATNYTVTFPGSGQAAPYLARGLEGDKDGYVISGNQITVGMHITQPGDWIRVVTVPEPATVCLLALGGLLIRRKRSV